MQLKQIIQTEKTKNNSGFSIIEAMIAICILSIGLLAVTSMQVSSSSNVRGAGEISEAVGLGTAELEELMTYSYAILTNLADPAAPNTADILTGTANKCTVAWSVTAPGDPVPNTVTIRVTVSWNPIKGGARSITLTSIKSDMNL